MTKPRSSRSIFEATMNVHGRDMKDISEEERTRIFKSVRTAPGRLLDGQAQILEAQERIRELEAQVADAAVADIDLDLIDEVDGRRRNLAPEVFAELRENIRRHGLAQIITVRAKDNGRYELIAGHNRALIYRELGHTKIRGNVVRIADAEAELAATYSNLLATSLSDFEKYCNFERLKTITGLTRAEIMEASGLSKGHLSRIMAFDRLPEEAKAILAQRPDRLGNHAAAKLAAAAEAGRAEVVLEVIKRLVADDGLSQDDAVKLATAPVEAKQNAKLRPTPLLIKSGNRKLVEITAREGVIGIKLGKNIGQSDDWAKKIYDFVEAELKKEQE